MDLGLGLPARERHGRLLPWAKATIAFPPSQTTDWRLTAPSSAAAIEARSTLSNTASVVAPRIRPPGGIFREEAELLPAAPLARGRKTGPAPLNDLRMNVCPPRQCLQRLGSSSASDENGVASGRPWWGGRGMFDDLRHAGPTIAWRVDSGEARDVGDMARAERAAASAAMSPRARAPSVAATCRQRDPGTRRCSSVPRGQRTARLGPRAG